MVLVEAISNGLQLPIPLITGMARKASYAYKVYRVPKRKEGYRVIEHPSKELKALQRWILRNIILKWQVHSAAFAYREGLGIKKHASMHVKSRYLLRMDFENFFPSITREDIDFYLGRKPPGTEDWLDEDRLLFIKIVCREEHLTIGAPTSPALSNAICFELDNRLTAKSIAEGVIYTRYADDLFFSADRRDILAGFPQIVTAEVNKIECPAHLKVNTSKTRHASKRGRRQVTGIVLSSDGKIALGRSKKRYIRHQLHHLSQLSPEERIKLAGFIAYAMDIEPDIINALILKFGPDIVAKARNPL